MSYPVSPRTALTSKFAGFLAIAAMAATASLAEAPKAEADAQWGSVSGNVLDRSHPCRTWNPCEGVRGATVYAIVYTNRGWEKVPRVWKTGFGGSYPTLVMHKSYWWALYAYKWIRIRRCHWGLFSGRSHVFRPTDMDRIDIDLFYRKTQRVC